MLLLTSSFICAIFLVSFNSAAPQRRVHVKIHIPHIIHMNRHTNTVYLQNKPKPPNHYYNYNHYSNSQTTNQFGIPVVYKKQIRLNKNQRDRLLARLLAQRLIRPFIPRRLLPKPIYPNLPSIPEPILPINTPSHLPGQQPNGDVEEIHVQGHLNPFPQIPGVQVQHSVLTSKDPSKTAAIKTSLENVYGPHTQNQAEKLTPEFFKKHNINPDNYDISYVVGSGYQVNEFNNNDPAPPPHHNAQLVHNNHNNAHADDSYDPDKITEYISFIQKGYLDQENHDFGSDHGDEAEKFTDGAYDEGNEYKDGDYDEANRHSESGKYKKYEKYEKEQTFVNEVQA